jgi:ribosomal protein L37AE/L43A
MIYKWKIFIELKTKEEMTMDIVIRECSICHYAGRSDSFAYIGNGIWSCPCCCSKYTEIKKIEEILEDCNKE